MAKYKLDTRTREEDLRFQLNQSANRTWSGASSAFKPDYDEDWVCLLFPPADETEIISGTIEMPHSWKEGGKIYPHVHVILEGTGTPTFIMKYAAFNASGDSVPDLSDITNWSTYTMDTLTYTWSADRYTAMVVGNPATAGIDMTGFGPSTIIAFKLYRQSGDSYLVSGVAADVKTWMFDIHYGVDKFGYNVEASY